MLLNGAIAATEGMQHEINDAQVCLGSDLFGLGVFNDTVSTAKL